MAEHFVPPDFEVPERFTGPGFHLEPLGPNHNERDYEAWMNSIDHIRGTPGMTWRDWPSPMTLDENMADMEVHASEFADRTGFTYSVLDGEDVIGCVYIYPSKAADYDADVRSWVAETRSNMDRVVWESVSKWLSDHWPFERVNYAERA